MRAWWLLLPLAVAVWGLVHASGVHATVAGVLLAFAVPVLRRPRPAGAGAAPGAPIGDPGDGPGPAEHFEHRFRPISAGLAVPMFAFLAAGVSLGGLGAALADPVAVGVAVALVVGKPVGIMIATWLVGRLTRTGLDGDLAWIDVGGLSVLAGIGFTVSLLIGELAFGPGSGRDDHVRVAILAGSLVAALLATVILRLRGRAHRRVHEAETADHDHDGVPDVYRDDHFRDAAG